MNEELNQINNNIKDLESKLSALKERKQQIQHKLAAPDLVGKHIYYIDDIFTYYMKVNEVYFNELAQSYIASGSSICIINERSGTNFELNSKDICILARKYEIINKERYNYVLKKAFDKF